MITYLRHYLNNLILVFILTLISFISIGFAKANTSANADLDLFVNKEIKFVTAPGYEPWAFYDNTGKLVGADVETIDAICKLLRAKCNLHAVDFDAIIPGIITKKYDVALALISVTEERKKVIAFTENLLPSFSSQYVVLANSELGRKEEKRISDIKSVGVINATVQASYQRKRGDVKVVAYPSLSNALLDLKSGRVDAVFEDTSSILTTIGDDPAYKPFMRIISEDLNQGAAGVVNKKNKDLLRAVNAAIKQLISSGELDNIYNKWDVEAE